MIFGETYSAQDRAERIIAGGRVVLGLVSFGAVWFMRAEPGFSRAVYAFLGVYACYAVVLAAAVWRTHSPLPRLRVATHVVDLAVFGTLYLLESHLASSFFLFFVFSLLSATLRWQWRGTLWTALTAVALSIGVGVTQSILKDTFAANLFIIRSVYLVVVAVLLGYLVRHEFRLRREISRLADWPTVLPADFDEMLADVLGQSADLIRSPRALLVFEEFDEPWMHVALWSRTGLEVSREGPDAFNPLVAPVISGCDFFAEDVEVPEPVVVYTAPRGLKRWSGQPVHERLRERVKAGAILGVRLASENVSGYMFWLDKPRLSSDDLRLGRLVARQVAARLDQFYVMEQRRRAAAAEERVHVARDLHDGLLQSLTAIALKLETLRATIDDDSKAAPPQLVAIQRLVLAEQRYLRFFIRRLKPSAKIDLDAGLIVRLELLAHRVELEWGVSVDLRCPYVDESVGMSALDSVYYLVSEAVVNAARHAGASVVQVDIEISDLEMRVVVDDNGRGFAFHGRFDGPALRAAGLGPLTLQERVADLDGAIVIDSTPKGSRIEIALPRRHHHA